MTVGIIMGLKLTQSDQTSSVIANVEDMSTIDFSLFSCSNLTGTMVYKFKAGNLPITFPYDLEVESGANRPIFIKSARITKLEAGASIMIYDSESLNADPVMSIAAPHIDVRDEVVISDLFGLNKDLGNIVVTIIPERQGQCFEVKRVRLFKQSNFLVL